MTQNQTGYIYKIICAINGKIYVGQTWRPIQKRFEIHCAEARWKKVSRMGISRAIRKHGKEHFSIELLETIINANQELLDAREIYWGIKLNSLAPSGYNFKLGNARGICSEITKRRIGNHHKGKTITEETRLKLRESHLGIKHTPKTRAKMSQYMIGKPSHPSLRIGASRYNERTFKLISPTGERLSITNMKRFCLVHNLSPSKMCLVSQGQRPSHRKWKRDEDSSPSHRHINYSHPLINS